MSRVPRGVVDVLNRDAVAQWSVTATADNAAASAVRIGIRKQSHYITSIAGSFGAALTRMMSLIEVSLNRYSALQSQGLSPYVWAGSTATTTSNQPDPFGGTRAVRVQASGGTDLTKALYNAGPPARDLVVSGQIWVRNRIATPLILNSNLEGRSTIVLQGEGWRRIIWEGIVGDGVIMVMHLLRTPTAADIVDCDVAFLQYEENPYVTSWQIGGATTIGNFHVHNQRDIVFAKPLRLTMGSAAELRLAASGTAGVIGAVTMSGYTA
ncbi:MAG: hypothetical protein DDT20_01853 [Firmicutes bacterium]|nr:hypothetical protein [Bacillota bacterium]